MKSAALAGVVLALLGAGSAAGSVPAAVSWVGSYSIPAAAESVAMSIRLRGSTVSVALGPGHAGSTRVTVARNGDRIRFILPGLTAGLVFDGRVRGGVLSGSVSQGRLHGSFRLTPGSDPTLP